MERILISAELGRSPSCDVTQRCDLSQCAGPYIKRRERPESPVSSNTFLSLQGWPDSPNTMSVQLKLKEADQLEPGESVQGFICFSWKAPLQKYCCTCWITMIQVTLEGYVTKPSMTGNLHRKKLYSSEVVRVRGIYGQTPLGELFPKRCFEYPFIMSLPKNLVPSCQSDSLLSVSYRLKTRVILCDPYQRSRDLHYSNHSSELDIQIPARQPSPWAVDPLSFPKSKPPSYSEGFRIGLNLITSPSGATPGALVESLVKICNPDKKSVTKLAGKLIQECQCRDSVVRKELDVFHIKVDKSDSRTEVIEFHVPFYLPDPMLPSVTEKDGNPVVAYTLQCGHPRLSPVSEEESDFALSKES